MKSNLYYTSNKIVPWQILTKALFTVAIEDAFGLATRTRKGVVIFHCKSSNWLPLQKFKIFDLKFTVFVNEWNQDGEHSWENYKHPRI